MQSITTQLKEAIMGDVLGSPVKMYDPASTACSDCGMRIDNLTDYFAISLLGSQYQHHVPTVAAPSDPTAKPITIFIKSLVGKTIPVTTKREATILMVKQEVQRFEGILVDHQKLIFAGRILDDISTLDANSIDAESVLHLIVRLPTAVTAGLSSALFDPQYDYDFTSIQDTSAFTRGGEEYKRPCGWKRYAIKVANMFDKGDNTWLGSSSTAGEWPVSYHGTGSEVLTTVLKQLPDLSKLAEGPTQLGIRAIYSTPDVAVAENYCKVVTVGTANYKYVFQNRIDPRTRVPLHTPAGLFYASPPEGIRPYSICVKRV